MICLPLRLHTNHDVLHAFEQVSPEIDLIEVWIDQIERPDLPSILAAKPRPLIMVCKTAAEHGAYTGSPEQLVELLKQSSQLGADYIGVELSLSDVLIGELVSEKKQGKLIISHHDFERTPPLEDLWEIVLKQRQLGADICKVATIANSYVDNLIIFDLVKQAREQKIDIIAMCMGEFGKVSRVMTPLLGSFLMYAPINSMQASASGQLTVQELVSINSILQSKG